MASLVQQLQADALDPKVQVSDLLRKASVVAFKLDLRDSTRWIDDELNGYGSTKDQKELPPYRIIKGEVKGWNPYHGWQPVIFGDSETHRIVSERGDGQSIGELDDLLASSKGETTLTMEFPHDIRKNLIENMDVRTDIKLFVSRSSVAGILDSVRNIVLEWALNLEKQGVLGEGMSFSETEKEKAASSNTTYNIQHFAGTIGAVSGNARVSVRQNNAPDMKEVASLVAQIERYASESGLPKEKIEAVQAEVVELKQEIAAKSPNPSRVRALLGSLKEIFEGVTSNVVAQGIIVAIQGHL